MTDLQSGQHVKLISKKDLLHQTGVSYGQFYRWKRMGLIPESWFLRRSTFTGQETFLPRQEILDRISRIQALKDDYSLEKIAEMLSPDVTRRGYSMEELRSAGWASPQALSLLPSQAVEGALGFLETLALVLIARLLEQGGLSEQQVRLAARTLLDRFDALGEPGPDRCLAILTCGEQTCVTVRTGKCLFDRDTRVVAEVNLNRLIEEITIRLGGVT
jgi:DNA-binding transcriptional MerR regulator